VEGKGDTGSGNPRRPERIPNSFRDTEATTEYKQKRKKEGRAKYCPRASWVEQSTLAGFDELSVVGKVLDDGHGRAGQAERLTSGLQPSGGVHIYTCVHIYIYSPFGQTKRLSLRIC